MCPLMQKDAADNSGFDEWNINFVSFLIFFFLEKDMLNKNSLRIWDFQIM